MGLAALLRQTIKLLAPTRVSNGAGGWTDTWAEVKEVPGQLHEVTGSGGSMEKLIGGQPSDVQFVEAVLDLTGTSLNGVERFQDPDGNQYEVYRIRRSGQYGRVIGRKV